MLVKRRPLTLMISSLVGLSFGLSSVSQAQTPDTQNAGLEARHYSEIEEIIVRALPMRRTRMESAQPVDVLVGETLDDRRGLNIGDTLQSQPGVQSSFYGAGAGRPIIRGMGGPRVRILEDGLATADTSTQSDDHAVSVDPLLIDQIEILRGPATLLYGSAASAGVINLIDGRIPEVLPKEPFSGRFELRGDSIADERSGVVRFDGGGNNLAWHIDGAWRDADDYRIPGEARVEDHDDDHDDEHDDHDELGGAGNLENSFVESRSATAGLSWIGERGYVGGALRVFNSDYGIPAPHAHFEADDDDHADHDDHDAEEEHDDHGDEYAYIDMEQRSWDIKGGLMQPFPGATRATFRLGYNDYTHSEREVGGGDEAVELVPHDDHELEQEGTVFDVQTWQSRLSFETVPVAGWEGAFGLQFERENFKADGAEAFVPDNLTRSYGVFLLQERQFDALTLSLGARLEHTKVSKQEHHDADHDADHADFESPFADVDSRSFRNVSASIGGIYEISESWQTSVNFARSQRAPASAELFAEGPHLATFSYEVGNGGLAKEVSKAWDVTVHRHSDVFDFEISVFRKDIENYIYLGSTGSEVGGFAVRLTEQQDAVFDGFEMQGVWQMLTNDYGHFELRAGYDKVNARLADNSWLPRISPERFSTGLDWHRDNSWRAGLEITRMMRQDKVPLFETPTGAYNMVNARLAYQFEFNGAGLEAFMQGRNLGNSEARVATSYLRDFAPLPGRNLVMGIRGRF